MIESIRNRFENVKEIAAHPLNTGGFLGAFSRYVAWNVGRRMIDCDFVIPIANDVRVILSNEENYATLAYTLRLWDYSEMSFLLHLLRPGDTFYDVGSNVGTYSMLASAGAGAHSVAFEPVPYTFEKLHRNIRLNDVERLVDARNIGVGEAPGSIAFTTGLGGMNRVARSTDSETVTVPVVTLDSSVGERFPMALKIDVEGYELPALRGGTSILASPELCAMIVEHNKSGLQYGFRDEDVHALISDHGFAPFKYDPVGRSLTPVSDPFAGDGLNTLYCRPNDRMKERLASAKPFSVGRRTF